MHYMASQSLRLRVLDVTDVLALALYLMQGDQRSPGIIPLAVKDAFSIIQEVLYKGHCDLFLQLICICKKT